MDSTANISSRGGFYDLKHFLLLFFLSVGYLVLSFLLVGFKTDQLILIAIVNGCYFASRLSRSFITGFSIFIVFWVLYDYMKAFPNYNYQPVAIQSLYELEKNIFGIFYHGKVYTPNEYFLVHTKPFIDVSAGFFYLSWIPMPLLLAVYLFFKNRIQFYHFALTFLFVNLIGFVIYYIYPAAPPWYIQSHGFEFIANTPGSRAGLERFDHLFNVEIFKSIYNKGSNVFAAMPSLHSSYPLIALFYAIQSKIGKGKILFIVSITVGIWFTAVYTSHHYILDVLAGILCAALGIGLYQRLIKKRVSSFLIKNNLLD